MQITHVNPDDISKTVPSEIGIRVTPFPSTVNLPQSSTVSDNVVPRCSSCGAFYNKFNTLYGSHFVCSLCGKTTALTSIIDEESIHHNCEVYEIFSMSKYEVRQEFVPTEFFVVSLSILQRFPSVIDVIISQYQNDYPTKQFGIAIIGSSISVAKFRDSFSLQTFIGDINIQKCSQYFAAYAGFSRYLRTIQRTVPTLQHSGSFTFSSEDFTTFLRSISTPFGTSVHLLLDEHIFHHMSTAPTAREAALTIARFCGQVSLTAVVSDLQYRSPLLDFPIITGGYLKFVIPSTASSSLPPLLSSVLRRHLYHDTFIFARAPDNARVCDFAGKGLLKTTRSIMVPKIAVGDTFAFSFDASAVSHPYFQFVAFYTSQLNVRKLRVITVPLSAAAPCDSAAASAYAAAVVAQRLLVEGAAAAAAARANLQRALPGADFGRADALIRADDIRRQCEEALSARDAL